MFNLFTTHLTMTQANTIAAQAAAANEKPPQPPKKGLDLLGGNTLGWVHGYGQAWSAQQDPGVFAVQDEDGVGWDMPAASQYAGAGLVSEVLVWGDFEAQVQFCCSHFAQGIALELAALAMGPPYHDWMGRDGSALKSKQGLVFDVHGTPPYVSAECDEDNGFRIGWNHSFATTDFVPTVRSVGEEKRPWNQPQSSNQHNRYGKSVLPRDASQYPDWPLPGQWHGLKLVRRGVVFESWFQLRGQGDWVLAGRENNPGMLQPGMVYSAVMPAGVHLRLAAKHWPKDGLPFAPATRVRFRRFELTQSPDVVRADAAAISAATGDVAGVKT